MARLPRTHCKTCSIKLTHSNGYNNYSGHGFLPNCRRCHSHHGRVRYLRAKELDPELLQANGLKYKYGLTVLQYNKMLEQHQGGCAICRQKCKTGDRLSVDHNHSNGIVRGLLCRRCNMALGMLNDDENLIWDIMEYLKRTTWKEEVA